jgi:hypothetical protein
MFCITKHKRGQSTIEYTVLIIIVIGTFIGMQNYFKRGLQGRWKAAIDELGDQYDPRFSNSSVRHTIEGNTITILVAVNDVGGFWTLRTDETNTIERKQGYEATAAF